METAISISQVSNGTVTVSSARSAATHITAKGHLPYSRRCTRHKYDESPTAGTIFDKVKFSLLIAFHIAFKISKKKKLAVVALEVLEDGGVGRAYGLSVDNASDASFRPFFGKYISKDAKIVTDEWNGYKPLMNDYEFC